MAVHLTKFEGTLKAVGNRVIVSDMYFPRTKNEVLINH